MPFVDKSSDLPEKAAIVIRVSAQPVKVAKATKIRILPSRGITLIYLSFEVNLGLRFVI